MLIKDMKRGRKEAEMLPIGHRITVMTSGTNMMTGSGIMTEYEKINDKEVKLVDRYPFS